MHEMVDGNRRQGRPRSDWNGDIRKWTGKTLVDCIRTAEDRENWKNVVLIKSVPTAAYSFGSALT